MFRCRLKLANYLAPIGVVGGLAAVLQLSIAEFGETLGAQSRVALVLAVRRLRLGGSVGRGPAESGWPLKLGQRLSCRLTLERNRSAMTTSEGGRDLRTSVCRVALAIDQT